MEILQQNYINIITAGVLLVFSAFFSSSETALFLLSREKLYQFAHSNKKLQHLIAKLMSKPRQILLTLLLGNMIVNISFYAISASLSIVYIKSGYPTTATMVGIGALLIVIIFGEVIPKLSAIALRERFAYFCSVPVYFVQKILSPFTRVLDRITTPILNVMIKEEKRSEHITSEEFKFLLELSARHKVLESYESEMMTDIINLNATKVYEIMTPRVDMDIFRVSDGYDELMNFICRTKQTRIAVYNESMDEIDGIIFAKDIFADTSKDVTSLVRKAQYIPEQATVDKMIRMFREKQLAVAIVVDEYGGTSGMVTLEDACEEFVGQIRDEYEVEETMFEDFGDKRYRISGKMNTREIKDFFDIDIETPGINTMGGFVTYLMQKIPRPGDTVEYQNIRFTIEEMGKKRVRKIIAEVGH